MAKWLKKVLGAAAVGTAAAGALYYWKKTKVDTDEFEDDFEDEDFDLDDDLKPAADREYVSLNSAPKSEEATSDESNSSNEENPSDKECTSGKETASEEKSEETGEDNAVADSDTSDKKSE